ncbi:MAG: hypothetical protein FJ038_06705 [Chloroflexi bacterium]|nr:hypothetical protein [Chloroflexota bacterium]
MASELGTHEIVDTPWRQHIRVDQAGRLRIEDLDAEALADQFGTPLYVISEAQIRDNVSRFRAALARGYPDSHVFFATKANRNLAVRRVFSLAGAGGDAFGPTELYLTLLAGTPPDMVVLNGFNKGEEEIRAAIEAGVAIHLDASAELDDVVRIARQLRVRARVGVRTRLLLHSLDDLQGDWPAGTLVGPSVRTEGKEGVPIEEIVPLAAAALAAPEVELVGLHHHIGRFVASVRLFTSIVAEQLDVAAEIRDQLGWTPGYLDFGGGMAYGRPEGHGPFGNDRGRPTYEEYADAITTSLVAGLDRLDLGRPRLIVEPGRLLASDIGVLLSRVGVSKMFRDTGQTWVGVDASWNHLLNVATAGWSYHPVPATHHPDRPVVRTNLADSQCWSGTLATDVALPRLARGDVLGFLDAGAYTESKALQFNGIPRPATVLVHGSRADVISERETLQDVIARHRLPPHLVAPR